MKEIESSLLLSSVIDLIDDLIFYKDKHFKYIGCNAAFLSFIGKTSAELIGKDDFELFEHNVASQFRKHDKLMLAEGKIRSNEEWVTYPDNKKVYLLTKKIPFVYDGINTGILGISRDITLLEKANQKLQEQTLLDELTQVKNRKAYNLKIKSLLAVYERYQTPFSIISIDIDDFKDINDNFGHDMGDTVLRNFGALLEKNIRETDHLFRIGGEEFVILSESKTKVDAIQLAEKLRQIVAFTELLSEIKVTISLGICEVSLGDSPNSIAKRVDKLLYEAKSDGKNKVIYHSKNKS